MKLEDFAKLDADGKLVLDNEAYQKAFNSELDRARQQASETAKKNTETALKDELTKKIREELENEAKLTAEEKLKKEREDFANEKKEFDKKRIQAIYKDAGISDEEAALYLGLLTDDSEKNLETANKIADERKKANEEYKKKLIEEGQLKAGDQKVPGNGGDGGEKTIGEQQAERFKTHQIADSYVDLSGAAKVE